MWDFILNQIQKNKIIYYDIDDKLELEDQIKMFKQTPCLDKQLFGKAMDN